MGNTKSNLATYRGVTIVIETLIPAALREDGTTGLGATGLTGMTCWFAAKRDASDPDTAAVLTKTATVTTTGDETHQAVVTTTINPGDLAALPLRPVLLEWEVKGKDTYNVVSHLDGGTLLLDPDVAQRIS